jgi:hypothetical protein
MAAMNQNPYQPPNPYGQYPQGPSGQGPMGAPPNRTMFMLAGAAAMAAAAWWALVTLLLFMAGGSSAPIQMILPIVLVVLYTLRGLRLFKYDTLAAKRIILLHVIGAVAAVINMRYGAYTFEGIKVAINIFGAITAYLASRPG